MNRRVALLSFVGSPPRLHRRDATLSPSPPPSRPLPLSLAAWFTILTVARASGDKRTDSRQCAVVLCVLFACRFPRTLRPRGRPTVKRVPRVDSPCQGNKLRCRRECLEYLLIINSPAMQ